MTAVASLIFTAIRAVNLVALNATWKTFLPVWCFAALNFASTLWLVIDVATARVSTQPASTALALVIFDAFSFFCWTTLAVDIGCDMSKHTGIHSQLGGIVSEKEL